ncbi:GntR family transcriptional regulator [Pseudoruegeria sp. SK021]|uniref:GntR family transcriptional regulator n=1 Tax=Pseudoruegeria sp. SK021 TaxID=1933035 RepID=UPI000A214EDE|nr:GntR family transcriptional regulator [Pseudoruegeria sp. SK021]OSP53792.1 GntR family transcriptional regulator [Pseudoruegeria sp. SK021]
MNDFNERQIRLAPVEKQTLHDQVANQVRDLIIEGHLEPGSRIDETALLEQLDVSRTPFREALRTLAAEGLVVIRPSRGSTVRKLSREDARSMLEMLAEIERFGGRLACERASPDEISALLDIHDRMMALYAARDRLPYYKLNQLFHTRVAAASQNATLIEIQGNIQAKLKRIRFVGNQKVGDWADAVADHEEMAAALRTRNGERLGEILALHLLRTWDRVKDSIG